MQDDIAFSLFTTSYLILGSLVPINKDEHLSGNAKIWFLPPLVTDVRWIIGTCTNGMVGATF